MSAGPLCFLHIPKTGGSSLIRALRTVYAPETSFSADDHLSPDFVDEVYERLDDRAFIYGHPLPGAAAWLPPGTRMITVVRQPAHQAVSAFLQAFSHPDNPDYELARQVGFVEFMRHNWPYAAFQTLHLLRALKAEPITEPAEVERGAEEVVDLIGRLFFVGLTGEMEKSIRTLSTALGLRTPMPWPRVNTAAQRGIEAEEIEALQLSYEALREDKDLSSLIALENATWRAATAAFRDATERYGPLPQRAVHAARRMIRGRDSRTSPGTEQTAFSAAGGPPADDTPSQARERLLLERRTVQEMGAILREGRTDRASVEDIYFCFRLLLGRDPGPGEIAVHMAQAGNDLKEVVSQYLRSEEFAARQMLATQAEPPDVD